MESCFNTRKLSTQKCLCMLKNHNQLCWILTFTLVEYWVTYHIMLRDKRSFVKIINITGILSKSEWTVLGLPCDHTRCNWDTYSKVVVEPDGKLRCVHVNVCGVGAWCHNSRAWRSKRRRGRGRRAGIMSLLSEWHSSRLGHHSCCTTAQLAHTTDNNEQWQKSRVTKPQF